MRMTARADCRDGKANTGSTILRLSMYRLMAERQLAWTQNIDLTGSGLEVVDLM